MEQITISSVPGFQEWIKAARDALKNGIPPDHIVWKIGQDVQDDLFATNLPVGQEQNNSNERVSSDRAPNKQRHGTVLFSKSFLKLCKTALCHQSPERFSLCYRVWWRLTHENANLLHLKTDNDMFRLNTVIQAVRRDAYKMTAFLRFREIEHHGTGHFIAWYEPEHYTLELTLDFFRTRFKNMRWSIVTPYRAAHWDTTHLRLENNPDPSICPGEDSIEKYWLTYYASTFNPARPKREAMLAQMPKKYWKNLPEAELIDNLLKKSGARTQKMLEKP